VYVCVRLCVCVCACVCKRESVCKCIIVQESARARQHCNVSTRTSAVQRQHYSRRYNLLHYKCPVRHIHIHTCIHTRQERERYTLSYQREKSTRTKYIHICTRAHTEQESEHATSYVMTNVPSDIYTHAHVLVHVHMCTCACERGTHVQYACTVLLVCSPLSHDILSLS